MVGIGLAALSLPMSEYWQGCAQSTQYAVGRNFLLTLARAADCRSSALARWLNPS